jgi:hypothetical protein
VLGVVGIPVRCADSTRWSPGWFFVQVDRCGLG